MIIYRDGGFDPLAADNLQKLQNWRPKEGVLMMTLREHGGAVNRLVVSPDQSYFCSASADHTIRVWQARLLDRVAFPR